MREVAVVLKSQAQKSASFVVQRQVNVPLALTLFGFQGESVSQTSSLSILWEF